MNLQKIVTLTTIMSLALYTSSIQNFAAQEEFIDIPDANFKACLNEKLDQQPNDDITQAQIEGLSALICSSKEIENIQGAQYLISAGVISFDNNLITDMSPLANLETVHLLDLHNNSLTNLINLQNITSLEILNLEGNNLTEIPNLNNDILIELNVSKNSISNINGIISAPNLQDFDASNNNISDLSIFSQGEFVIENLFLEFNEISDTTPLINLDTIDNFAIHGQIITLDPIGYNPFITLENFILSPEGANVQPDEISDQGLYDEATSTITWNLSSFIPQVDFMWEQDIHIGNHIAAFHGQVIQPLEN